MKQKWKRIGSLILSICMVFTMLPTMVFAETGDVNSGTSLCVSGTITAFAELSADVAEHTVETGTAEDELNRRQPDNTNHNGTGNKAELACYSIGSCHSDSGHRRYS